jgi:hypothetical protein
VPDDSDYDDLKVRNWSLSLLERVPPKCVSVFFPLLLELKDVEKGSMKEITLYSPLISCCSLVVGI